MGPCHDLPAGIHQLAKLQRTFAQFVSGGKARIVEHGGPSVAGDHQSPLQAVPVDDVSDMGRRQKRRFHFQRVQREVHVRKGLEGEVCAVGDLTENVFQIGGHHFQVHSGLVSFPVNK